MTDMENASAVPAEAAPPVSGADRRLVLKSSLATLAALGTGTVSALAQTQEDAGGLTDAEILNFALNLEYLEAEFYLRAVTGTGLSQSETTGKGRHGRVVGGHMVPFKNDAVKGYATEIANDEHAHVDFLRAALGSAVVAEPSINLRESFDILAQAAGLGNDFDPFQSEENFILGAFVFEDVGVTAYHGAAPFISNKTYLSAAAGILAVEAYHAGLIRTLCYQNNLAHQADKISRLRNKLSAEIGPPKVTDQGIILHGQINIVPATRDAIAFARTPYEVLNIVYAGGASGEFGFFPHKVNGKIH